MWRILKGTITEFQRDECPRLAAALAFYTVSALPAIVIAVVTLAGFFANRQRAEERLQADIGEYSSPEVAKQIGVVLHEARRPGSGWAWLGGMAILLFGASGALAEVQTALNRAWGVKPDPQQSVWRHLLVKRLLSLAMLAGIALLLLASLIVTWGLAAFHHWLDSYAPAWLSSRLMSLLNVGVSFFIIALLFAAFFRFVPDAELAWKDVSAGALVTAALFVLGKSALGYYFAWSHPGSAYGAAGSVALVLLWIYYSANILFLGAEFTQVLATSRGTIVNPQHGAVRSGSVSTEDGRQ